MLEKIGIILPVRDAGTGRSERLKDCLDSYEKFTENLSDIFVLVDEDDKQNYEFLKKYRVNVLITPYPSTLMQKINYYALDIAEKYKYIFFLGDDIVFKTMWEKEFVEFLSEVDFGLAYGNDLIQGSKLATHPCITSNMIRAVGFFGCPAVSHNYFDNYWMDMVTLMGKLRYFDNIIMEHNHPSVGKNQKDSLYFEISKSYHQDYESFLSYMQENRIRDAIKIKESLSVIQ